MLSFRKTSDAVFIQAAVQRNDAVISRYYRESCRPIVQSLARRFPDAPAEVVKSSVNDAVMTVITQYLDTKKIYVEGGKVIGTKRGKLSALIAYIARCSVVRHFKWLKRYGSANLDDVLRKHEMEDVPLTEEEDTQANEAVMQAFKSLSEKCQEILSCRIIHGMSYEEVLYEDIGSSKGGLRVEAHRCVKQLRARFLKYFFDAPTN